MVGEFTQFRPAAFAGDAFDDAKDRLTLRRTHPFASKPTHMLRPTNQTVPILLRSPDKVM